MPSDDTAATGPTAAPPDPAGAGEQTPSLQDLLAQTWAGEILGEAFFRALSAALPEAAPTWELLARLEATTGALVEPVARAHGATVDAASVEAQGASFGAASTDLAATIDGSLAVAAQFLDVYEALAGALPPAEGQLGAELLTHEHALAACLRGLRDGTDASAQVRAYLARHQG